MKKTFRAIVLVMSLAVCASILVGGAPNPASAKAAAGSATTPPVISEVPDSEWIPAMSMTKGDALAIMKKAGEDAGLVYEENLTEEQNEWKGTRKQSTKYFNEQNSSFFTECIFEIPQDIPQVAAGYVEAGAIEYEGTLYFKPVIERNQEGFYDVHYRWRHSGEKAPGPSPYSRPFDVDGILAEMRRIGEELGMTYDPSLEMATSGYRFGVQTCFTGDDDPDMKRDIRDLMVSTCDIPRRNGELNPDPAYTHFLPYVEIDDENPGDYVFFCLHR